MMKYIFNNSYIDIVTLYTFREQSDYLNRLGTVKKLNLDTYNGDFYYSYVVYNSLTSEKRFVISFNSDYSEEKLNFMFWTEYEMIVLHTGRDIFLISTNCELKASIYVLTPFIGFYLIDNGNLLLLGEAEYRLINGFGQILDSKDFSRMNDWRIEGNMLLINTDEYDLRFDLNLNDGIS